MYQQLRHSHKQKFCHRPRKSISQSDVVTIDDLPHAQQTSDVRECHHVGYGPCQLVYVCYTHYGAVRPRIEI